MLERLRRCGVFAITAPKRPSVSSRDCWEKATRRAAKFALRSRHARPSRIALRDADKYERTEAAGLGIPAVELTSEVARALPRLCSAPPASKTCLLLW